MKTFLKILFIFLTTCGFIVLILMAISNAMNVDWGIQ